MLVLMGLGEPHGAQESLSGYKRDTQKGESPSGGGSLGHVLIRTYGDYYNAVDLTWSCLQLRNVAE